MEEMNKILAILDNYLHDNPDEIAHDIAADFRRRRIEKNYTREQIAEKSGVPVSNIVRFEQKGLISLKNLIGIALAYHVREQGTGHFYKALVTVGDTLSNETVVSAGRRRLTCTILC